MLGAGAVDPPTEHDPGGPTPSMHVVSDSGSGDDAIVDLVRRECTDGRRCVVVTADRGLRDRVAVLGAELLGPRSVPRRP